MSHSSVKVPEGVEIRYTEASDAPYLKGWLSDPEAGKWFPMDDSSEIEDAVARWLIFSRFQASLTALKDGVPCGIATLYLQPYRKLAHQCEFGIIVGDNYRSQGIGTYLMNALLHLAKERFKIDLIHLQVYSDNLPAIHLYQRFGFTEFGKQEGWAKDKNTGESFARSFMERKL